MGRNMSHKMENVLILFIELRCLLTGNDYILMKRFGGCSERCSQQIVPGGAPATPSSSKQHRGIDQRILEVTNKITQLLTGEVPIRYEDIVICFTTEEWKYVEKHKDLYKDVMMGNQVEGDLNINNIGHSLSEKIGDSQPVDIDNVRQIILHLTEEVIHLLIKEKYILIWSLRNPTTPSDNVTASPPLLVYKRNKDEKILELAYKINNLLTGKVPIRYKDIAICFSMEEWEYVKRHKDVYKDVVMDNVQEDNSSSYIRKKRQECPGSRTKKILSHLVNNEPRQVTENSLCTKSEEYLKDQPNLTKHKKVRKRPTVTCGKCGIPLKGSDIINAMNQIGVSGSSSEASYTFCRPCLHKQSFHADKGNGNGKNKPFSCMESEDSISSKQHVGMHLKTRTSEKVLQCPECDRVFHCAQNLETHMRVHTGEKPYKCEECNKSFCNIGNLKAHYRVHTGERPFTCSECDQTFCYKSHLAAHQKYHTGETLQCSECEKLFVYRSHFLKHLQTHTGVKPYTCPECGKSFNRSYHLHLHSRIHTKSEPSFKCKQCNKSFQTRCSLSRHGKTHTGQRPYKRPNIS